jgi:DNA-binding Lrp family transcriptional regulator
LRAGLKNRNPQAEPLSFRPDVTRTPLQPEVLDLDILREMYRGGAVRLAGVDPRLNATSIAHRLRVGRARVAARLKAWDESGFLQRYDVWLNPSLFGWQGAWLSVQVDHPRVKPGLFPRLALIDGAISGTEFLGEWVSIGLVVPDAAALDRRISLIRGLAGVRAVEPPALWQASEPKRPLTPLDIRIVRALRENPTATLGETAQRVRTSTRTMTRRYSDLVENGAVWFVPVFDFRAISFPVISLSVTVRAGTGGRSLARRIRARYPLTLDFQGGDVAPAFDADELVFFVLPPSAAHLEEVERFVTSIEGVAAVEANVMVRMHSFPAWFDRHLETLSTQGR